MARIFTKPTTEAAAKAWIHDVMAIAGILQQSQRTANEIYFTRYSSVPVDSARKICDELINRDFTDIDSSIRTISHYQFYDRLTQSGSLKQATPEYVVKVIIYAAELFNLYWDDTIRTPYELEDFKKTMLGEAVFKYGRHISAIQDKPASRKSSSTSSGTANTTQSAPKNDFRQQGPKSSQATGLINLDGTPIAPGQPGQKVFIDKGYALAIRGTVAGKASKVRAVITPLNSKGASGSKNKVYINASHGYGVAECLFDEMSDATDFYNKLVQSGRVPSDVTDLQIGQISVDKNGYFLVDTEFGICAIAARVLNEEVDEAVSIDEDLGAGWRKATEGYTKEELAELHDSMRQY
jgi:hypothetical protein